jgi:hypothetical protein
VSEDYCDYCGALRSADVCETCGIDSTLTPEGDDLDGDGDDGWGWTE